MKHTQIKKTTFLNVVFLISEQFGLPIIQIIPGNTPSVANASPDRCIALEYYLAHSR
jgi:hypothetical protein